MVLGGRWRLLTTAKITICFMNMVVQKWLTKIRQYAVMYILQCMYVDFNAF